MNASCVFSLFLFAFFSSFFPFSFGGSDGPEPTWSGPANQTNSFLDPNTKKKNERRWKNPYNKIQKYRQRKWEAKNIDNLWIILNSTRFFAHILQSERPLNKQDKGIHIFCGNLVATVLN